jgi:RNA polymerase sigma-70 factor (ECF subfamily)
MLALAISPSKAPPQPASATSYALRLHGRALALYDGVIRGACGDREGGTHQQKTAFRSKQSMTEATEHTDAVQGIEGVLLANRGRIVRFLQLRGAGDLAEDMFQDLWMRLTDRPTGPVGDPLPYIMRAANNLMLDRYRSSRQRELRDQAWSEAVAVQKPLAEASLISRQQLSIVEKAIDDAGPRPSRVFRRFRVDGQTQRDIAAEMGVSLSTVEADLRKIYSLLAELRRQFDAS